MRFSLPGILAAFGVAAVASKDAVAEQIEVHLDAWSFYDADFKREAMAAGMSTVAGRAGWMILKAIALNESSLGADKSVARGIASPLDVEGSKSQDGKSWGLMQFTLPTARDLDPSATEVKLNNPRYSINLGARYVAWLSKQFNPLEVQYIEWVIKSYNQGVGNSRKERTGAIAGYADEYWARFQRNLAKVESNS